MKHEYPFQYFNCQSCASGVNCMQCKAEIEGALEQLGVADVVVDMPHRIMKMDPGGLSEDAVLDYLETIGVFVG